jgi:hypothetical protein
MEFASKEASTTIGYFLGKTPSFLTKEEVLDYFMYAFELQWVGGLLNYPPKKIRAKLEKELDEKLKTIKNDTAGKRWWLLSIYVLLLLSQDRTMKYSEKTLWGLWNQVDLLSEDELEMYCNLIDHGISMVTDTHLTPRPLALQILGSEYYDHDKMLQKMLHNTEKNIRQLHEYVKLKELTINEIVKSMVNPISITQKYTDMSHVYYELLMIHVFSEYEFFEHQQEYQANFAKTWEEVLHHSLMVFFYRTVKDKTKIEPLTKVVMTWFLDFD